MGTFLSTVVALTLVYGGTAGVELVMARYATPETRSLDRGEAPALRPKVSAGDPHPDGAERA